MLRPVSLADIAVFETFYANSEVMSIRKFGVLTASAALLQLQNMVSHWRTHGFGLWAVLRRDTETFAGECGLRWLEDGTAVELSYGLLPAHRGKGLATEATRAAIDHGVNQLGLAQIVALSRDDNVISHRVLEKLGMRLQWHTPGQPFGLVQYALRRTVPSCKGMAS